jgi:D-beta-D-heptose 7-phosphate kinase/D-beta-D-heptose 1-phosphate adenosyltransferase
VRAGERGPLVVVGDVLLDRDIDGRCGRLCPDAPVPVVDWEAMRERPGGAGLCALLAARLGTPVTLVTALADDGPSARVRELLAAGGVRVELIGTSRSTAEKTRIRAGGQTLLRVDRGEPGPVAVTDLGGRALTAALAGAGAVLVADYARGLLDAPVLNDALRRAAEGTPLVWDPHPRGGPPVAGAWLVTPNRAEALAATRQPVDSLAAVTEAADGLRDRYGARAVAVTLGAGGALLATGQGPPLVVPCGDPSNGDVSGAGDAFAVGAARALADGAVHSEAVAAGVALGSAFVGGLHAATWSGGAPPDGLPAPAVAQAGARRATQGSASPAGGDPDPAAAVIARARATGGTVVMTGGCFDLLHRGHVQVLNHARSLGDCLVVCLNSDDSVRRLKGAGRPVVPAVDRARVLRALSSVDEVVVFDEDTPTAALDRYRPDLFVKGGDYGGVTMPEAAVLAGWGGQVVIVPYIDGHSTSRLLQEIPDART